MDKKGKKLCKDGVAGQGHIHSEACESHKTAPDPTPDDCRTGLREMANTDFKNLIPSPVEAATKHFDVVIGITTTAQNNAARKTIREVLANPECNMNVVWRFVISTSDPFKQDLAFTEELSKHDDIIILPGIDVVKQIYAFLRHAVEHWTFSYLVRTDDMHHVCASMLLKKVGTFSASSEFYYGTPSTSTQGCALIKDLHMTRHPPAMASDTYVISGGLVRDLAKSSVPPLCTSGEARKECTCEDVVVSFWLAPYDIKRIFDQEREWLFYLPTSVEIQSRHHPAPLQTKTSAESRVETEEAALPQANRTSTDSPNAIQLSNGVMCQRAQAVPETIVRRPPPKKFPASTFEDLKRNGVAVLAIIRDTLPVEPEKALVFYQSMRQVWPYASLFILSAASLGPLIDTMVADFEHTTVLRLTNASSISDVTGRAIKIIAKVRAKLALITDMSGVMFQADVHRKISGQPQSAPSIAMFTSEAGSSNFSEIETCFNRERCTLSIMVSAGSPIEPFELASASQDSMVQNLFWAPTADDPCGTLDEFYDIVKPDGGAYLAVHTNHLSTTKCGAIYRDLKARFQAPAIDGMFEVRDAALTRQKSIDKI